MNYSIITCHKGLEINIGQNDDDILELFGLCREEMDGDEKRKIYMTEFTDDLIKYGFKAEILPYRSLPESLPKEKELSFLRGLYSANGYVINHNKNSRVGFKTTCKTLADQLVGLLSKYDIISYITTNKSKKVTFLNGEYLCRESYDINITRSESISKFYEKIGFVHVYKMKALKDILEIKGYKVIKINKKGLQDVYDFSVDDIHWGFVDGVMVHNCGEQTLHDKEMCNLCETFPVNHDSYEDYEKTLFFAYFYAKGVTTVDTQWKEVNEVIRKNRRIGISQSGIIDAFGRYSRREVLDWCDMGYTYLNFLDKKISKITKINESIKLTTVKPSGTVSLLAGVSSGIHYPHSKYYIRRVRIDKNSDLIPVLKESNYYMETDNRDKNTLVVDFPCKTNNYFKSKDDVSMWEQVGNAIDYQRYWSDNQVSITVTFKPEEMDQIPSLLEFCEDKLKGLSLLPLVDHGYEQAPYEKIEKDKYKEMVLNLNPICLNEIEDEEKGSEYCDGGFCPIQH
jgi:ribonucleotide reductase alpha subunit